MVSNGFPCQLIQELPDRQGLDPIGGAERAVAEEHDQTSAKTYEQLVLRRGRKNGKRPRFKPIPTVF